MNGSTNTFHLDILKPYIRYFAIAENDAEDVYKVLPGTSLVMGFRIRRPNFRNSATKWKLPYRCRELPGCRTATRVFRSRPGTGSVLVYFNETGASSSLKHLYTNYFLKVFHWIILLGNRC